jgi:valyl-tRNA synthetase
MKRVLLLFGIAFSISTAFAENNVLQSIEIEPVKEIIKCVRNVKVQVGAAPSKKVTLYVKTENKKPIKNGAVYIQKLAGVSDIQIIEDKSQLTEKVVSQVIDGFELFIPLGELVDMQKEIERLQSELENVEREISRASGKLSNNGFLEKAPKALVDAERAKRDKYLDMRDKISAQLKDLKG